MRRSISYMTGVLVVTVVLATTATQAAIIGVTDSRVQGFFGVNAPTTTPPSLPGFPTGGTLLSDPSGIPAPVAPPTGSNAVAGVAGVDYVNFTFPGGRNYSGAQDGVSTGTAITGGFFTPGTSISDPFVLVPLSSFLVQDASNPLTWDTTSYTHLNFSIDYSVDAGGLAGDTVFAFYNVFGNAFGAGTAQFLAVANYWFEPISTPGDFINLGNTSGNDLQLSFSSAAAGPYNEVLLDAVTIAPLSSAGTLRINGFIRWQGIVPGRLDGSQEIQLNPTPEPSTWALLGLGIVGLGVLARRRVISPDVVA